MHDRPLLHAALQHLALRARGREGRYHERLRRYLRFGAVRSGSSSIMETRAAAQRRASLRACRGAVAGQRRLPAELWSHVLSFLPPTAAAAAAVVCSEFAGVSPSAAAAATARAWPQHAVRLGPRLAHLGVGRCLSLIAAHEAEAVAHPDQSRAAALQRLVLPEHRQIAVEWLIEVREGTIRKRCAVHCSVPAAGCVVVDHDRWAPS